MLQIAAAVVVVDFVVRKSVVGDVVVAVVVVVAQLIEESRERVTRWLNAMPRTSFRKSTKVWMGSGLRTQLSYSLNDD